MSKNNTGNGNSGNRNSGDGNSGDRNSGYLNSGYWNSGDRNSGHWNSGNWNSGYLNTDESTVRMFNKQTNLMRSEIVFPDYFYFEMNTWVDEEHMTKKEKEENDQYRVTGGYLKVRDYKDAWREAWDNADDKDRRKTLALPNWDNEIFREITGIDVEKELSVKRDANVSAEEITVNGKRYRLVE